MERPLQLRDSTERQPALPLPEAAANPPVCLNSVLKLQLFSGPTFSFSEDKRSSLLSGCILVKPSPQIIKTRQLSTRSTHHKSK